MDNLHHYIAAQRHLIDIDQNRLSVSVIEDYTEEECYNQARVWLERAITRAAGF